MSRFDPELLRAACGSPDTPDELGDVVGLLALRYRELYEAAEAMAEAIENFKTATRRQVGHTSPAELAVYRAAAAYRKETEG